MKPIALVGIGLASLGLAASVHVDSPSSSNASCSSCSLPRNGASALTAHCLAFTEVEAGKELPLRAFQNGTALPVSRLSAEFGAIRADGTYVPPAELPPYGVDEVTISDAQGIPNARMLIQFRAADGPAESPMEPATPRTASSQRAAMAEVTPYDTRFEEIIPLADVVPLSPGTISGVTGRAAPLEPTDPAVPASMERGLSLLILGPAGPKKGKKCGFLPKPTGGCTNGTTKTVLGPVKIHRKGPPFAITLSYFTVSVTYLKMTAWAVQYIDYYACVDGAWSYTGSRKCTRAGAYGWAFDPSVLKRPNNPQEQMMVALGYGTEGYKWDTPWQCDPATP